MLLVGLPRLPPHCDPACSLGMALLWKCQRAAVGQEWEAMPWRQMATAAWVPPHPRHQGGGSGHPLVDVSSSLCWVQGASAQGSPGALQSQQATGELNITAGLGSCRQGPARVLLLEGSGAAEAGGEQPPGSSAAPGKDPPGRHRASQGCSVRAQPALCLSFPIPAVLARSWLGVLWPSTVLVSPCWPQGQCPARGRVARLGHEVPEGRPRGSPGEGCDLHHLERI